MRDVIELKFSHKKADLELRRIRFKFFFAFSLYPVLLLIPSVITNSEEIDVLVEDSIGIISLTCIVAGYLVYLIEKRKVYAYAGNEYVFSNGLLLYKGHIKFKKKGDIKI